MLLCDGFGVAMDLGSPRAKRSAFFLLKSQHEGPGIHCGKNHGRIYGCRNNKAASEVHMQISAP